jgi:hypothetical protein
MECSPILGVFSWADAVRTARNYCGGGFTDWRLPTKEELNLMYQNLRKKNIGGMGDNKYWSSSESISDRAWNQYFSDGSQYNSLKNLTLSVRAVRAF